MNINVSIDDISVRPLTSTDWLNIKNLFGAKGACGGCWCMYWRVEKGGKLWEDIKGDKNRDNFRKLLKNDRVQGILAFHGDLPIGWCSFGQRSEFPRILRMKAYQRELAKDVWAINCFYLHKDYRGFGVGYKLAEAAVSEIKIQSKGEIEAYPVTLTKEGKKLPAAFSFTGSEAIFKRLGFKECQRLSPSRPMYLLKL